MQQPKKKAFCKEQSRVKLVVYDNANKQKSFYSFIRDDRKGYEHTIGKMKERILVKLYGNRFNSATFYNTYTDSVIERVSTDSIAQKVVKSKVKLLVYDKENKRKIEYSNEQEDQQGLEFILGSMQMRILQYKLCGKYNVAIFYNMLDGEEITRITPYGRMRK